VPTPAEHRALLFVAVVAALGVGVRGLAAWRRPEPPLADREALAQQLSAVDSLIAAGGRRRGASGAASPAAAPAASPGRAGAAPAAAAGAPGPAGQGPAGTTIDVNVASAGELDRLPGIGPALASRIVADREANGPFGSVEALQRVRGIGPALAARLAPHVTFSRSPRPIQTGVSAPGDVRRP
jgi:competence ComEA-like helix-hairpin-helix protein